MAKKITVRAMDGLYTMTQRQFARWLAAQALGRYPSLDDFGAKFAGECVTIIDISAEQAHDLLRGVPRSHLSKEVRRRLETATYNVDGWYMSDDVSDERAAAEQRREQQDVCAECGHDGSVPHRIECSHSGAQR